jgi:hypothetical protein
MQPAHSTQDIFLASSFLVQAAIKLDRKNMCSAIALKKIAMLKLNN